MLKRLFHRLAPVSKNPLHGVISDTGVEALRQRNACRLEALCFTLGHTLPRASGRHANWDFQHAGMDEDPHRPWWPAEGG